MGKHSEDRESSRRDKESKDKKEKKDKKERKDKKRRHDDEDNHETREESKHSKSSSHDKESKKENGHSSKKLKEDHKKHDDDAKDDDRDADTDKREDSEEELVKKIQEEDVEPDDESALDNFDLSSAVKERLRAKGILKLFPIQYESFDYIRNGRDLVGKARTGTGKTLAFVLPVVERLLSSTSKQSRYPRVIVLTPTRELAKQIYTDFNYVTGSDLNAVCVYGGTPMGEQIRALRNGADIVVGTPGRIIDLLDRACLNLEKVDHIILDEADEMLNRGFSEDVEKILSNVPKSNEPVTMLFSATIPPWVKGLMNQYLKPGFITIDLIGSDEVKASKTVEHISVSVPHWELRDSILFDLIKTYSGGGRTIIFVKTKAEAVRLQNLPQLSSSSQSLHGDIKQDLREMALNAFKQGNFKILIATDVAARGLDIPQVELVLQTEPPSDYNTYIHRAGRTGRAGRSGRSLVMYTRPQKRLISILEHECKIKFKKVGIPHVDTMIEMAATDAIHNLEAVDPSVIDLFRTSAQNILKQYSPEEALARALANVTGYTKPPPPRSLFGRTDFQTILFTTKRKGGYITKGTVRNFLSDALGRKMPGQIYLTPCVDEASLVVDLPAPNVADLPPAEKCQVDWQLIKELPELQEEEPQRGGWNQGGGNFRGGNRGYGGYGQGGFGGNQGSWNRGQDGGRGNNDWRCDGCGFSNFGSRSSCKQCNAPRSGGNSSGGRLNNNNSFSGQRKSWGNGGSYDRHSGGHDRRQSNEGYDRRQSTESSHAPF